MARTNHPINQVLIVSDLLQIANKTVTSLSAGQIGMFNYDTGLSLSAIGNAKRVFFAVGVDRDGDSVVDDIVKSTGEYIEAGRIHHSSLVCPTQCIPEVIQITPKSIKGNTEYTLKIMFQNESLLQLYGYNLPTKVFVVKTGCCEANNICDCDDNSVSNKLALDLVKQINLDKEGVMYAELYDSVAEAVVDVENFDTWITDSGNTGYLSIRIYGSCEPKADWYPLNYNYHKLRGYHLTVSFFVTSNLSLSSATITTIQELVYEQGSGYDIAQLEYIAGGWNGKPGPYRSLELADRPNIGFSYNVNSNGKYVMIVLGHDAISVVGFQEPINDMETIFCIPCELVVESDSFVTDFITLLNSISVKEAPLTLSQDCCVVLEESVTESVTESENGN